MSTQQQQLGLHNRKHPKKDTDGGGVASSSSSISMIRMTAEATANEAQHRHHALNYECDDLDAPLLGGDDDDRGSRRKHKEHSSNPSSPTSPSSSSPPFEKKNTTMVAIQDALCSFLDLFPNSSKLAEAPSPAIQNRVYAFRDAHVKEFSSTEHKELVEQLWAVCNCPPGSFMATSRAGRHAIPPLPENMKTEEWKNFGFQGVDPGTDFRGGGVLSLRNMLFMAHTYPSVFSALLRAEFPFAIASINVTMVLMNLLEISKTTKTCLSTSQKTTSYSAGVAKSNLTTSIASSADLEEIEANFHRAHTLSMMLLLDQWGKTGQQNIMLFNAVLKVTHQRLMVIFRRGEKNCVEELRQSLPLQLRQLIEAN